MEIKKNQKKQYKFLLFFAVLFCIFPLKNQVITASTVLTPYVIQTGNKEELVLGMRYSFSSDGEELLSLEVPEDGAIIMNMYAKNPGTIIMQVYTNPDGTGFPMYWNCECSANTRNYNSTWKYFDKGTYYICFPKNTYEIDLCFYSNVSKIVRNGSLVVGYIDYEHPAYYSFHAKKDGYVTIVNKALSETNMYANITMCDNTKREITETIHGHEKDDQVVFAVKKNKNYKFKVSTRETKNTQFYQFSLKFTELKEKSGTKKKNAVAIAYNKAQTGLVMVEDPLSSEDWYKVTNSKSRKVKFTYSGSITSGSMIFDIFDAKGNHFATYSVLSWVGEEHSCLLTMNKRKTKLPKGTYYIKVTKSRDTATGVYSVKFSNYQ